MDMKEVDPEVVDLLLVIGRMVLLVNVLLVDDSTVRRLDGRVRRRVYHAYRVLGLR